MGKSYLARHTDYVQVSGNWFPVYTPLPAAVCTSDIVATKGARHVDYFNLDGTWIPRFTSILRCCDAVCTQAEIDGDDCYKLPEKWPFGPGPGITKRIKAKLSDIISCLSARNADPNLLFDEGDQKWHGSITLRGGTLNLTFEALGGLPGDPPGDYGFRLTWDGCDGQTLLGTVACADPLLVRFTELTIANCCDCPTSGSPEDPDRPVTDAPSQIDFEIQANCRRTYLMRHVDYVQVLGIWYPRFARERPCAYDRTQANDCEGTVGCGMLVEITVLSGTTCLAGTYPIDYLAHTGDYHRWESRAGVFSSLVCGSVPDLIIMTCARLGLNEETGLVEFQYTVRVMCSSGDGQDQTASVVVTSEELEDLDFFVDLTYPAVEEFTPTCWTDFAGGVLRVRVFRP